MDNLAKGIIIIFITTFLSVSVKGLVNPSAAYCKQLGYEYTIEKTLEGEFGICKFPNGSLCEEWNFIEGKCGQKYSYCKREGYEIKTISDIKKCSSIFSEECAVCVFENGTEIEVTKLMNLDLGPVVKCGDGICGLEEEYFTCPQDCPSGAKDGICDEVEDGICDDDCVRQDKEKLDPDCKRKTRCWIYIIIGLVIILIIFLTIFIILRRRHQN
ncbi:MAG: DUF333 domain-containing protein [Bacteroidetes bacterium]|nr:DUF333 domain-containing protein [Bacteroidota bacterium]MBL7170041.1 DUF333 domain-containing protein [Candidatus Aenigmarchaeota archaeon]